MGYALLLVVAFGQGIRMACLTQCTPITHAHSYLAPHAAKGFAIAFSTTLLACLPDHACVGLCSCVQRVHSLWAAHGGRHCAAQCAGGHHHRSPHLRRHRQQAEGAGVGGGVGACFPRRLQSVMGMRGGLTLPFVGVGSGLTPPCIGVMGGLTLPFVGVGSGLTTPYVGVMGGTTLPFQGMGGGGNQVWTLNAPDPHSAIGCRAALLPPDHFPHQPCRVGFCM